jgi:hypothetical protein
LMVRSPPPLLPLVMLCLLPPLVLPNWGHTHHTPAQPHPDPDNAAADTHSPPHPNTNLTPLGDTPPLPLPLYTQRLVPNHPLIPPPSMVPARPIQLVE